jgi:hypothetical protein
VDALFLLLLVFVILLQENRQTAEPTVDLFAPVFVGIRWADNSTADVDLWVRTPGDRPVGYSRIRGSSTSLLRDDLGSTTTPIERTEVTAIFQARDGEYAVNLHLFSDVGNTRPVSVTVRIWRRSPAGYEDIYTGTAVLRAVKEETTAIRFAMRDGHAVPGSFHATPVGMLNQ